MSFLWQRGTEIVFLLLFILFLVLLLILSTEFLLKNIGLIMVICLKLENVISDWLICAYGVWMIPLLTVECSCHGYHVKTHFGVNFSQKQISTKFNRVCFYQYLFSLSEILIFYNTKPHFFRNNIAEILYVFYVFFSDIYRNLPVGYYPKKGMTKLWPLWRRLETWMANHPTQNNSLPNWK